MAMAWPTVVSMGKRIPPKAQALKPPAETLGQRIRRLREWRGLDQTALAAAIGQDGPSTISRWETSATESPRIDGLRKLARALNVQLEDLLGGDDSPKMQMREPTTFELVRNIIEADRKLPDDRKRDAVKTLSYILGSDQEKAG